MTALPCTADALAADRCRRSWEATLRRYGIRERWWQVEPDLEGAKALAGGRGLWVWGPVGSGKTTKAAALALGWLASHVVVEDCGEVHPTSTVAFASVPDLLGQLRSSYDGEGSESGTIRRHAEAGLLVLDDMGKGAPTEWALERLFQVVNARWENLRPVVVTSQQRPADMARRLASMGDADTARAIVSRLVGMCEVEGTSGPDRRLA